MRDVYLAILPFMAAAGLFLTPPSNAAPGGVAFAADPIAADQAPRPQAPGPEGREIPSE